MENIVSQTKAHTIPCLEIALQGSGNVICCVNTRPGETQEFVLTSAGPFEYFLSKLEPQILLQNSRWATLGALLCGGSGSMLRYAT